MPSAAPAPVVTGNIHDVLGVRYINTPRPQYVSDGGRTGSKSSCHCIDKYIT